MIKNPYYPIIYVRGYAGTQGAVEDTVATPYMGFNLGSTKFRQAYGKENLEPWVFESPLIRLMKDHGYVDAYRGGQLVPEGPVPAKSIWIFRYYDVTSKDVGAGERKEIEFHARRLQEFIHHVRESVIAHEKGPRSSFKAYLVAHSMGGLICRCYLQNSRIPDIDGKKRSAGVANTGVDKLFTYATPHGGIEFTKGLGWVEGFRDFLDVNNAGNFGEKRMRAFLDLGKDNIKDLRSLNDRFPIDRVFCLVGTDSRDYGAAAGMSRRSVGPLSDGLVQIKNAYVEDAHRAFVHRSHSGHYGIVNSEEGYQNLQRFLFGQLQAKLLMEKVKTTLPEGLRKKKKVSATYYIETVVSIRGIPVEIHRRTVDNEAALHRERAKIEGGPTHLHTLFLDKKHKVTGGGAMGFLVRMRLVPQYHVEKKWWPDNHFEGNAIYDDGLVFLVTPKKTGPSKAVYYFTSQGEEDAQDLKLTKLGTGVAPELEGRIPFASRLVKGDFVIRVRHWNYWK